MSVLIKHMAMPKGCIYANDKDQTEYCPLLNHDEVPFCQYIENEPEIAIGIDERPVYCPLSDVPEPCQDTVSRQAAIDIFDDYNVSVENGELEAYSRDRKRLCELPSAQPERKWISCANPPKHHKDVIVKGIEAIGNVTVYKVMQWDVDMWRPENYAPSIRWLEWCEI